MGGYHAGAEESMEKPGRSTALESLLARGMVLFDGAMGTMLHSLGMPLTEPLPELSVSRPELVRRVHLEYLMSGADVIETNTFGASRQRLARYGLERSVSHLVREAARLAIRARDESGTGALVAGVVSPLVPPGSPLRIGEPEVVESFTEQLTALAEGGVDLLSLETFGDLPSLVQAVSLARRVTDLPVVAQVTFLEDGRTPTGDGPAEVADALEGEGVLALGANCTLGPQALLRIVEQLAHRCSVPICAQPNAGPPTLVGGRFEYAASTTYFARMASRMADSGVRFFGGCCGTTPAHIGAVARQIGKADPQPPAAEGTARSARSLLISPRPSMVALGQEAEGTGFPGRFLLSWELRCPVGGDGRDAVEEAISLRLAGADSVVIMPGRTSRAHMNPVALALLVSERAGLEAIVATATAERSLAGLQADLLGAHALGLRKVLCHTGTPPLRGDYPQGEGADSVQLVRLLRDLNSGRDLVGGSLSAPTAFTVGARVNPTAADRRLELERAAAKVEGGAHFLVTPPVFDTHALLSFLDELGATGLPVLMGLEPLLSLGRAEFLRYEVPETRVPDDVLRRLTMAGSGVADEGLRVAAEVVEEASERIDGVVVVGASQADEPGPVSLPGARLVIECLREVLSSPGR